MVGWPTSASTASPPRCTSRTLWIRDVTITTGLVDTVTTPTLLKLAISHQLDASRFVTHHFRFDEFPEAYDVFRRAGDTGALKVVLDPRLSDTTRATRLACLSTRRPSRVVTGR